MAIIQVVRYFHGNCSELRISCCKVLPQAAQILPSLACVLCYCLSRVEVSGWQGSGNTKDNHAHAGILCTVVESFVTATLT